MDIRNTFRKLVFYFLFFCAIPILAQETIYSKVRVQIEDKEDIQRLASLDFDIDHYEADAESGISFFVTQDELQRLQTYGFTTEVTIPNFDEYYSQQRLLDAANIDTVTRSGNVANGFDFGSMGGFYTYDEVIAKLDEMKTDYPNLITAKTSIGTTIEGNTIWMVKISDNPDLDEAEPAVYFDGLHHSREPLSMATNINYMFWLLEHYDTDSDVEFLINNRELYFVPVVNPDGYLYNESTNPNGGGLWRKNRKVDPGGCVGVDLNRNYSYEFAHDGSCASTDPCSNTYHGGTPFSELESIAVRDLLAVIEPNMAFSIHSTAGSYLMPYGFDVTPPEYEIYSEWASSFLDEADYPYGVTFQMLGYTSCGTTRDYLHSEGIYGWTPEIDGSGFWPQQSEIFGLVEENVRPMFYQSWIAGAYLDVQSHTQIGNALPGESFELVVEIKNVGVGDTSVNSSVVVQASVPEVNVPTATGFGDIPPRSRQDNSASPFSISIDPSFTGSSFVLTVFTIQNGVPNETAEIEVHIGTKDSIFFDDAEGGDANWTASGNGISWSTVTDDSYSGVQSFGDSNGGNSLNSTINYFKLNNAFDLTVTNAPRVSFASKYSIEAGDNVTFQASTDGGNNWDILRTFTLNESWHINSIDLSAYKAFTNVEFRFALQTNNFIPGDGFYFDDFEISDYNTGILGILNTETLSNVRIYPNPFDSNVLIAGIKDPNVVFYLYDLNGRKLNYEIDYKTNMYHLSNISGLMKGIYFLKIENGKGASVVKKLIKK